MVSTRNHPRAFPPPAESSSPSSPSPPTSPTTSTAVVTRRATSGAWSHTPSNVALVWLAVSLPLVIWDTGYVMLRPHSMPGGSLHAPIWKPYALYGTVDYVYGKYAWDRHDGFTGAQGSMNIVETLGYFVYLYIVFAYGKEVVGSKGRGAPKSAATSNSGILQKLSAARTVGGSKAGAAVLILFAMSVMTLSKTILYWLNEYFSGFAHIGHNSLQDLILLWIIPNGAWIVVPAYLTYISTAEILQGLSVAAGDHKKRN